MHDSIVAALESQKAAAAAQNYASQLVAEARKDGLDKTAQAHNLHVITTDFIGRDGVISSLPDSTAVLTAAFTAAKGAAPQSATTGEGYAIFQVLDVKPAHAPDFASWKSHVLDDYREQQAPALLNAQLIKLADRAKVLNDLAKAAAEMKLPVKTSDFVGRDTQIPDVGSMSGPASVLFTLPRAASPVRSTKDRTESSPRSSTSRSPPPRIWQRICPPRVKSSSSSSGRRPLACSPPRSCSAISRTVVLFTAASNPLVYRKPSHARDGVRHPVRACQRPTLQVLQE